MIYSRAKFFAFLNFQIVNKYNSWQTDYYIPIKIGTFK